MFYNTAVKTFDKTAVKTFDKTTAKTFDNTTVNTFDNSFVKSARWGGVGWRLVMVRVFEFVKKPKSY